MWCCLLWTYLVVPDLISKWKLLYTLPNMCLTTNCYCVGLHRVLWASVWFLSLHANTYKEFTSRCISSVAIVQGQLIMMMIWKETGPVSGRFGLWWFTLPVSCLQRSWRVGRVAPIIYLFIAVCCGLFLSCVGAPNKSLIEVHKKHAMTEE